jgi:hypothetical protein
MLAVVGCSLPMAPQLTQEEGAHNLLERLEDEAPAEGVPGNEQDAHASDSPAMTIEELLTEVEYVAVQQVVDRAPFYTIARTDQITQLPCSNCHTLPLATLQAEQKSETESAAAAKAHWDLVIDHADESVMNCKTCHNVDNPDELHTLTGHVVEFDHSYQVCAQCHGQQYEDWQGGAHGKRVGGWAPPRVVQNCVECHNPHQPAWDIRWPAVTNSGSQE